MRPDGTGKGEPAGIELADPPGVEELEDLFKRTVLEIGPADTTVKKERKGMKSIERKSRFTLQRPKPRDLYYL
jgi:hypothetical protein